MNPKNRSYTVEIIVKTGKLLNIRTNLMAVFLFQENRKVEEWLNELDILSERRISDFLKLRDFKGDLNETSLLYMPENANIRRVMFVGLGKKREFDTEKARQVFGTASKTAQSIKLKRFMLCLAGMEQSGISKRQLAHVAAEGILLSLYKFTAYKSKDDKNGDSVKQVYLFDTRRMYLDDIRYGVEEGVSVGEAVCYARDLASHPANIVTPEYLADEARKIAKKNDLTCTIFTPKELKEKNMNAILGVSQGSKKEPRLIVLEYACGNKQAETIALVGKGLTFDSGGISIKPAKKMEEMKYDMCGAAAVLGTMKIVKQLSPRINVIGVIASAENMPGGAAIKPGDIIKTYSGVTVEIINTDAEGRLVLCDALSYTINSSKPDAVIDIATLTGSVIIALGHFATGMLGNNAALLKKVTAAGKNAGEMVWELPLYPEYDEHIKSDYADIKNSDGHGAGAIFGGTFLKRFVGKTPWVHLDIAGTAYDVKEKPYLPKGPTGVGVRLFSDLIKNW